MNLFIEVVAGLLLGIALVQVSILLIAAWRRH